MAGESAEFVIEIAASMPEGEATIQELDELTQGLLGGGKSADYFQQAIKQADSALGAAKEATIQANKALADGAAHYKALENEALAASKAAEKAAMSGAVPAELTAQIDAQAQAVKRLSRELDGAEKAFARGEIGADVLLAQSQALRAAEKEARALGVAARKAAKESQGIVPQELQDRVTAANAALHAHASELRKLEAVAGKAEKTEAHMARTLANTRKLAGHADKRIAQNAEQLAKASAALSAAGGPLGAVGAKVIAPIKGFQELSGVIGSTKAAAVLGTVAIVALGTAIAAAGVYAVKSAIDLGVWAVGLADAARTADLTAQAIETMNPALAGTSGAVADAADEFALGRDEVQGFAKALAAAKVPADQMDEAIRAAAQAERALGKGGAQDAIEQLKAGKIAAGDFADTIDKRLGGIAAKRMLGLDLITTRLEKKFGKLFGGLRIDQALAGVDRFVNMFSETEAIGENIKALFGEVFQPLVDGVDEAAIVVEAFILGFLIQATKMYIALKPAIKSVKELLGFDDTSLTDMLGDARKAGEVLAKVAAGIFAGIALGIGIAYVAFRGLYNFFEGFTDAISSSFDQIKVVLDAVGIGAGDAGSGVSVLKGLADALAWSFNALGVIVGAALGTVALGIAGVIAIGKGLYVGLVALKDLAVDIFEWFTEYDWAGLGKAIVDGIVTGIIKFGAKAYDAIAGLARGAIDTAKSVLGIHSPSREFQDIADDTTEGFTGRVEDNTPEAHDAVRELVAPSAAELPKIDSLAHSRPANDTAAWSGDAPAGADNSSRVEVRDNVFNFYGVQNAEHAAELIEDALTRVLEGDVIAAAGAA